MTEGCFPSGPGGDSAEFTATQGAIERLLATEQDWKKALSLSTQPFIRRWITRS